jgi:hypothetical protein
MNITHDTTIEEYEAWLATNPPFSAFKVAVRATFKAAYKCLDRISQIVARISGKLGKQACAGAVNNYQLEEWQAYSASRLREINRDVKRAACCRGIQQVKLRDARRVQLANQVDDEIAMEGLKIEALEILRK